jgi:hypothetical protein
MVSDRDYPTDAELDCISTRAGGRFTFKKPRRKKCTTEQETQLK